MTVRLHSSRVTFAVYRSVPAPCEGDDPSPLATVTVCTRDPAGALEDLRRRYAGNHVQLWEEVPDPQAALAAELLAFRLSLQRSLENVDRILRSRGWGPPGGDK